MGAPYTGNPNAIQAPSPAPGPRVFPVGFFIADTDGASAANFYQEFKVDKDFIAYIQSAIGLDLPRLNSGTSGFTAVSTSGLGGTVTPSGSVHHADGIRFLIQIQTGGAVGVATFKTSMDGGATYGALQTTAASMTDATSGITLAFSGTFTANGTAGFASAFTPLATWVDQAGNLRSLVDHNGYRRGRVNEYYEDWMALGNGPVTGAATNNAGRLAWNIPASATALTSWASVMPGALPSLDLIASNVANATAIRLLSAGPTIVNQTFVSAVLEFEVAYNSSSNIDWKVGWTTSTSGVPSNAENAHGCLCKQATDTNWQLLTSDGSTFLKTNTGVAPTALDRILIEFHGTASPYGSPARSRMWINDALVAQATTNLPANGVSAPFIVVGTTTSGTNSANFFVGPVRVVSNRYLSTPPL